MFFFHAAALVAGPLNAAGESHAQREQQDCARALVRLAAVDEHDGVRSGELSVVAARDGALIAWVDGQGARITLVVLDASAKEVASDAPEASLRPARVELTVTAGSTFVIHWEASAAQPWGWLCVSASVSCESELTLTAPRLAREAFGAARELANADDAEGQRALLEGAISELLSMPGAATSRAVADGLWSLVFAAYSCGALESALAAANSVAEIRARFEPATSTLVQNPRIGAANVLSELTRDEDSALLGAQIEANYARSLAADDTELAKVRLNLANYLRRTGELDRPALLVADALAVYECRLPIESDERQRAMSLAATIDHAQGRIEQAAALYRDIYRCALKTDDDDNIEIAAGNYAIALSDTGELELARQIEEDNLIRSERRLPKSHPALIALRENLAVTLLDLGDYPRARALLELAQAPYESDAGLDRVGEMRVLSNLAELERLSGDLARARELFERALKIAATVEDKNAAAMPLNGLAQTMLAAGDNLGAQQILEKLLAARLANLGESNLYTQTARIGLADCLHVQGDFPRAVELGELALARLDSILPKMDQRVLEARLLVSGARVHAGESDRARADLDLWLKDVAGHLARESLNGSPRFVEERAYSWRNQIGEALGLALELGADSRLAEAGLTLLETCRASSLWAADALRLAGESQDSASARSEIARLSRELSRASAAETPDAAQFARVTAAKDKAERRLLAGLTLSSATIPWGEPMSLDRVRAALGPADAALSYTTVAGPGYGRESANHMVAFVLHAAAPVQLVDLGLESTIATAVLGWRRALGTEGTPALSAPEQRTSGEVLRRLVFDPLRSRLDGVQRIFVTQEGALNLVSLDSLPDADKVLGDSRSLHCVPTLAVLACASAPRVCARRVVLIGGLDYGAGALPELAGAGAEVERVAEVYRASNREVRVLRARAADRDTFAAELAGAGVLHIATHGELSPPSVPSDPQVRSSATGANSWSPSRIVRELSPLALCGLALSGANEHSPDGERAGFVRGVELASMDASQCELVVLSACDSRAGVERPGLAVASLEKAMHLAGARSVLASLWQVDDAQAQDFMVEFHRGLVEHSLSPADALWRAKNLLRSRRAPIRAWAGWILSSVDAGRHE